MSELRLIKACENIIKIASTPYRLCAFIAIFYKLFCRSSDRFINQSMCNKDMKKKELAVKILKTVGKEASNDALYY